MKIELEIKGSDLVVSLITTQYSETDEPRAVDTVVSSASLSLETIRQAMNSSARSRYKSEPMK